jgi:hydrogenase-4 component E
MNDSIQLLLACEILIFLSIVIMHMVKRNSTLVYAYVLQSAALCVMLGLHAIEKSSIPLLAVTAIIFIIKVIVAPIFFLRLIKRSRMNLSATTYLNVPVSLAILIGIVFLVQSDIFAPVSGLIPAVGSLRMMLLSSIFMSLYLVINRKGALSQITGILCLENSIVAFGFFIGFEQLASLELGILFDILLWIVISTIFAAMIFRHFGTLDVTKLSELKQ